MSAEPAVPAPRPSAVSTRLTGSVIVTDLDDQERQELEQLGVTRRHARGSYLMLEGDRSDHALLIRAGRLKIVHTDEDGRELVMAVRGPGELVGEVNALAGANGPRSASVVALDDVLVQSIRADELVSFVAARPNVSFALMRQLAARMREATTRQSDAARYDSRRRVARVLVEQAERFGQPDHAGTRVRTGLTQHELAGLAVASPTSVVRALAALRARGVITTARCSIVITDMAGLRGFTH